MPKLPEQILRTILSRRKPSGVIDSINCFELLDLAERVKAKAELCLQHPWRATYTASFMLMRIRESLQSTTLLLSTGLVEDALTINRKCFELTTTLLYVLGTGYYDDWWNGKGIFRRSQIYDLMSKMPFNFLEPGYELYQTLSGYTHSSQQLASATASEYSIVIDPRASGLDANSNSWPALLVALYRPFLDNFGFTLVDLYYPQEGIEYRTTHLHRNLFHLAFRHPKLYNRLLAEGEVAIEANTRKYIPLMIKEGILNEDHSPGPVFRKGIEDEFSQLLATLDPAQAESARETVQKLLNESVIDDR